MQLLTGTFDEALWAAPDAVRGRALTPGWRPPGNGSGEALGAEGGTAPPYRKDTAEGAGGYLLESQTRRLTYQRSRRQREGEPWWQRERDERDGGGERRGEAQDEGRVERVEREP